MKKHTGFDTLFACCSSIGAWWWWMMALRCDKDDEELLFLLFIAGYCWLKWRHKYVQIRDALPLNFLLQFRPATSVADWYGFANFSCFPFFRWIHSTRRSSLPLNLFCVNLLEVVRFLCHSRFPVANPNFFVIFFCVVMLWGLERLWLQNPCRFRSYKYMAFEGSSVDSV